MNADFPEVKPGDPVSASRWNAVLDELERQSVYGSGGNGFSNGAGRFDGARDFRKLYIAKAVYAVAKGTVGEFRIFSGPKGQEKDTGVRVRAYSRMQAIVAAGWAFLVSVPDGMSHDTILEALAPSSAGSGVTPFVTHRKVTSAGVLVWGRDAGADCHSICHNGVSKVWVGKNSSGGDTVQDWDDTAATKTLGFSASVPTDIDADATYVYLAQHLSGINKYANNGTNQWSKTNSDCIAIDSDGDVYAGTYAPFALDPTGSRWNSAGTLQSGFGVLTGTDAHVELHGVAANVSKQMVVIGGDPGVPTARFIESWNVSASPATLNWRKTGFSQLGGKTYSVVMDSSSNVWASGNSLEANSGGVVGIRKYDNAGVVQLSITTSNIVALAVDSAGNIYGAQSGAAGNVMKWDSSGVLQWTYSHGDEVKDICVDSSGNLYLCGDRVAT